MKVLHICAGNLFGGVETLLVTIARNSNLCPDLEESFALCFEGRLKEELSKTGSHIYMLGKVKIRYPWTIFKSRRKLQNLLEREKFDIVICHSCWPQVLFGPIAKFCRIPLVFWCHDFLEGKHWLELCARKIKPDFAIANSHFTLKGLFSFYHGVPCEVLYYPVSPVDIENIPTVRKDIRKELNTQDKTVVIIQVSRMERWKGHKVLISALSKLENLPNWTCWIAGGAQRVHERRYMLELQEEAQNLKISEKIRFLGERNDIADILLASDIFCQPNIEPEPFGISFIEALYAGLPVVSTAIGGALEIVNESCGKLVEVNDIVGLSRVLNDLITYPEERAMLTAFGPMRAKQLCDPQKQINQLLNILTGIVKTSV